jgi:hypothetical protein
MSTDWADLLRVFPGAAKAVAELVQETGRAATAFVSIATARARQIEQGINDETTARTKIVNALADAGVSRISDKKEELGQRAIEHFAQKVVQQQVNRESVTLLALERLASDPPPEPPKEVPADDWLNLFGSFAERASSQKMREHWAQILSGEIRKPGSFSFVTLQLSSVLDQRLASIIEKTCGWIVDRRFVPMIVTDHGGPTYQELLTLDGIGFLSLGTGRQFFTAGPQGHIEVPLKDRSIWFVGRADHPVTIDAASLTLAGTELLNVISYESNPELVTLLTNLFRRERFELLRT